MNSSLDWMKRDNPNYDPNRIGNISEMKICTALMAAGKLVWRPLVGFRPCDYLIEDGGAYHRVQCKTGRLFRGAIRFAPQRLRAAKRETGWQRCVKDYEGDVDFFGIYCPELDSVYLVPITVVGKQRSYSLRVSAARNNQRKQVHWAADYLVVPQSIPGC
jgi:hypothetical protein